MLFTLKASEELRSQLCPILNIDIPNPFLMSFCAIT